MQSTARDDLSQIALYGTGASSCGYCSSSSRSGRISYGLDAHIITPCDYQALIDRGWRRSGTYIYLPNNTLSCCPNWTIRLHVPNFKLTRQHRKVQNKFTNYVRFGPNKTGSQSDLLPDSPDSAEIAFTEMHSYLSTAISEVAQSARESQPLPFSLKLKNREFVCNVALIMANRRRNRGDPSANSSEIARELVSALGDFCLRYDEHELILSSDDNGFLHFSCEKFGSMRMPSRRSSSKSTSPVPSPPFVNYTAEAVPARFSQEAFDIYRLYQVAVHHDEIERLTERQYRTFLCDSPIMLAPSSDPNINFGSFHIEYRFDGNLIGVSVVDILPQCVSSVYFFYDPDYAFLSLGVWSALHEISLVPSSPSVPDFQYYYLGYYVHNCPKMRYKKQFAPAELLCNENLSWHPLEKCILALQTSQYVAFSTICEPSSPPNQEALGAGSVDDIPFKIGGQCFHFRDLKQVAKGRLLGLMQEYYQKVGAFLATRRFVVTNIYMSND